jgi:chromosome segregation ATPase
MMRKKNTDISKSNNDLNDVEYLKTRITLLDNVVQKITKEKNTLNQELERTKYELLKKNQELETKLASKETELRRMMNKLKPLELEYKNINSAMIDEKKRLKECQKNLETVSAYLYQSYMFVKKNMQGLLGTFKQGLFAIG